MEEWDRFWTADIMASVPKFLIMSGIVLILVGVFWYVGGRLLPLGKLPGDILIQKSNFRLSFPIVSCLIISIVVSLLISFIRFLEK